jgi:hypothetical protein
MKREFYHQDDRSNSDWCDDTWTFENSHRLVVEARRVSTMLARYGFDETEGQSIGTLVVSPLEIARVQ